MRSQPTGWGFARWSVGVADGGAWCPRRRRQRRMPLRCSEVMLQSCALFVASLASSQLAGRWPCRRILQPRGWTVPNYHPGWTVFHLPSTPWADDGRPIHILRLGYTRLGLQGSERGSSPPPRRGRDPAAQPRRTPASPQALLARASSRSYFDLAGKILVGSSCMANWMHSWLIGQILLMRRRHHAGFRAGDEFFQTTESPSKH